MVLKYILDYKRIYENVYSFGLVGDDWNFRKTNKRSYRSIIVIYIIE